MVNLLLPARRRARVREHTGVFKGDLPIVFWPACPPPFYTYLLFKMVTSSVSYPETYFLFSTRLLKQEPLCESRTKHWSMTVPARLAVIILYLVTRTIQRLAMLSVLQHKHNFCYVRLYCSDDRGSKTDLKELKGNQLPSSPRPSRHCAVLCCTPTDLGTTSCR